MGDVKIGIHYFMWLHEQYWDMKPDASMPLDGVYNSSASIVVDRHVRQLAALGVDYVILHVPAMRGDGSFRHGQVIPIAQAIIPKLKAVGIGHTLMIDVAVTGEDHRNMNAGSIMKTLDHFASLGLLDDVVAGPSGSPLLMTFSPPHNAYVDELNRLLIAEGV